VLAAVAVSIVPLAVFAVERLAGWWPLDDAQGDYHQYYTYVQGGWLAMEAATVLAGLLMLRWCPSRSSSCRSPWRCGSCPWT
jgi:hypothetical protein